VIYTALVAFVLQNATFLTQPKLQLLCDNRAKKQKWDELTPTNINKLGLRTT